MDEDALKESDFNDWHIDYNKSWQMRFMHDLQCLQKAISLVNDALAQKELAIVDEALRSAVLNTSSLASTFEHISSDPMHLRHALKDADSEEKSEH